jgi:hypothetical protein
MPGAGIEPSISGLRVGVFTNVLLGHNQHMSNLKVSQHRENLISSRSVDWMREGDLEEVSPLGITLVRVYLIKLWDRIHNTSFSS